MLNRLAKWLGIDSGSRARKRETRIEESGKAGFYPARDEAIRIARRATVDELIRFHEAAESETIRMRGTPRYHAALGVLAGVKQVMRERGIRRSAG